MHYIEVKNVSQIYSVGNEPVNALTNISFAIEKGEFIAVTGPSGCGKSTLLLIPERDYKIDRLCPLLDDEIAIFQNFVFHIMIRHNSISVLKMVYLIHQSYVAMSIFHTLMGQSQL